LDILHDDPGAVHFVGSNIISSKINSTCCYHYCCTVHLVDSLIITQPTNALIVFHLV